MAPAAVLVAVVGAGARRDFAFDFEQFWRGGRDVLDGRSPYPPTQSLPSAEAAAALDPHGIQDAFGFPYPPATAVAMAPFGALPFEVAAALMTVILVGAVGAALWLLGVRDWRCYGVAYGSIATIGAVRLGTLTPLLLLAVAAAWRFRDRRVAAGVVVGVAVLAKGFLWPLPVWLLATRRYGAAAVAALTAAGATAAGVAALGWESVERYRALARRLVDAVEEQGYSIVALVGAAGGSDELGRAVSLVLGGALLALVVVAGRRSPGDATAFAVAVCAALALSPIVWLHYFVLLLAPVAVLHRRLSWLWLATLALWATPFQETDGELWRIALGWAVTTAVLAAILAAGRPALIGFRGRLRGRQPLATD